MKLFFIGVSFLFFTENYRSDGTAGFTNTGMNEENQDQKWMLAVSPWTGKFSGCLSFRRIAEFLFLHDAGPSKRCIPPFSRSRPGSTFAILKMGVFPEFFSSLGLSPGFHIINQKICHPI
jgi:hypothetical protein